MIIIKKLSLFFTLCMTLILIFVSAAYAFNDLPEGPDRDKVRSLQDRGIVNGYGDSFKGENQLTNAEGVHLIVKAFDLNLGGIRFIKEPLASDSFDSVPNDAWYSQDFVIAAYSGLSLPRTIDPEAAMTREQFAHYLLAGLLHKGNYGFTKMQVPVADESDVNPDYRYDLQLLLNGKIAVLDADRKFYPIRPITRLESAVLVYNALAFMDAHKPGESSGTPSADDKAAMTVDKVNDDINRVTLTWGEKPNNGYALSITGIVFTDSRTAEIHYKLIYPENGKMYGQVVTTPKAVTYLSSAYTPVPVVDR